MKQGGTAKFSFAPAIWGGISIVLWNKIYKRTVLSGLKFINATVSEDSELTPKILYGCSKIVKINSNWYNFNIRPKSLSRSKFNIRDVSAINARKSIADFFAEKSKSESELKKIAEYTMNLYYDSYYNYFCLIAKGKIRDILKKQKGWQKPQTKCMIRIFLQRLSKERCFVFLRHYTTISE